MIPRLPKNLTLAAILLSLSAAPAFSQWRVDQRPNTLSVSKELVYRYEKGRGEIEDPQTGVNKKIQDIHHALRSWITRVAALKLKVDQAAGTDVGKLEGELAKQALDLAKEFDVIYANTLDVSVQLNLIADSLRKAKRLNYSLTVYQAEYDALISASDNLISNVEASEAKIRDLLSDIRGTVPLLHKALLARLRINLINAQVAGWEEAVQRVSNLFETDLQLNTLTKPFQAEVRRFNKYALEARYFSVLDLGGTLSRQCVDLKQSIRSTQGHQAVKDSYLRAVTSLCRTLESDLELFAAEKPGDVLASGIHDLRLGRLKNRCSSPHPGQAKCQMLLWLGKLTREQIAAMDDNTLRGLEALWAEAEGEGGGL